MTNYSDELVIKALVDMGIADGNEFRKFSVDEFIGSLDTQTVKELKAKLYKYQQLVDAGVAIGSIG